MNDYVVRGRSFYTISDYQAALRDEKKIDFILKKYDNSDLKGKEHIINVLDRGEIKFETVVGEDFLVEFEEKHSQEMKKRESKVRKSINIEASKMNKVEDAKKENLTDDASLIAKDKEEARKKSEEKKEAKKKAAKEKALQKKEAKKKAAERKALQKKEARKKAAEKKAEKDKDFKKKTVEQKVTEQRKVTSIQERGNTGKSATTLKTADSTSKKISLDDYDEQMQRQIRIELYLQEQKRKRIVLLCSIVAILCLGYVFFYYYLYEKNSNEYEHLASLKVENGNGNNKVHINYTTEEKKELVVLEKYKNLFSQNKSLIGWIKIDDTNIDYPVMQTVNNEYYLDHNYNQQYDKNGSIFLDKDCDITNPGTNMIIYGHHMNSGKMFGKLNLYSNKEYYEKHPIIQFDTIYEEGRYQVMYVFRSRIYNENDIVFKYYQFFEAATPEEFDSNMNEMARIALYDTGVTATYGDKLITLSTCDYNEQDGRFVVVAKKIN